MPRWTFLMPRLASSLSPAISAQLFTLVCKNKSFSKYRVSASVNELSVDHLQLLLSAGSPINANSLLLLSIILPALTQVLRVPDRHSSPLQVWASVRFLRQLGDFLETTSESVNDAENKYCTFSGCLPKTEDIQSHMELLERNYFLIEKWNI